MTYIEASREAYIKAASSGYKRELEEIACKEPHWSYMFALHIEGADIEYCQEGACKDPYWAYIFARNVTRADLNYCSKACKGTEYYAKIQECIMEEALI